MKKDFKIASFIKKLIPTFNGSVGSSLAIEYACVPLSIVLKILFKIPGFDPYALFYNKNSYH
jgi:hypothetical protein